MRVRSTSPSLRGSSLAAACWALAGAAMAAPAPVKPEATRPEKAPSETARPEAGMRLHLDVYRNSEPTGLIAAFRLRPDGELVATVDEIRALGLAAPPGLEGEIALRSLPGVDYRYDEPGQRLFVVADARAVLPTVISFNTTPARQAPARDAGILVNYSLSASAADDGVRGVSGVTGAFDARVFGRFGLAESALVVAATSGGRSQAVRLDTRWTYDDVDRALSWRAGDLISGGLAWTRPLRLGGVQFRRDFGTRPDIVTIPTPVLSATAAVPSMLEVAMGPSVLMLRRVPAGPVEVTDLPIQGRGEARLVLRDAFGAEQVVSASYFASPQLLRAGLADFSFEAGFARRGFGLRSADYDDRLLVSATGRYGLSDNLTLQGHSEAGGKVVALGGGLVRRFGALGTASAAAAASRRSGAEGALFNVAFESRVSRYALAGQVQRTVGEYRDVAAETATRGLPGLPDGGRQPRTLVQATASGPLELAVFERWGGLPTLAVTYALRDPWGGPRYEILNGSVSYILRNGWNLQAAAFISRAQRRERGVFLAVSAPLGSARTASAGLDQSRGRSSAFAEVRQQESIEPGGVGWRLRADRGRRSGVAAEAAYRGEVVRVAGRVSQYGGTREAEVRAEGSVVWLDGPLASGSRIDGAFAAVDVGVPGVGVRHQNRLVARSDADGRALVTNLDAYSANLLAIETTDLPLSALASVTRISVSPPYGSGVRAAFRVTPAPRQGMVWLRLPSGAAPPAGARARFDAGPFDRVVGYDGQVFVEDAAAVRDIQVELGAGALCIATLTATDPETFHGAILECR